MVQTPSTRTASKSRNSPRCPGCRQRDGVIEQLRQQLTQVRSENQKLREQLGRNSTNSSVPPSANPLHAPKPQAARPGSGRKRGGQEGHPPAQREIVPLEQLAEPPIACIPTQCEHCSAKLSGVDPWPMRHQVIDVPPIIPEIREYHQHVLQCRACGESTRGQLPAGIPTGAFGPRLQALIGLCTGCYHLSKRQTEEFLTTALNIPISLGSICRVEQQLSSALAEPVAQAHEHLQHSQVAYADETSWKQQPDKSWLWVGLTNYLAVFLVRRKRDRDSAHALLGTHFQGVVVSDRYTVYQGLKRRQICWAHLRRDWQAFIDRGGSSQRIGQALLDLTDYMFRQWHLVRDGTLQHLIFYFRMLSVRDQINAWLRQGCQCAHAETAGTCREILNVESALWTFSSVPGVEPTNNAAERALRQAVLWRKKSFGTRSPAGSQYVERILTAVTTCRLQGRSPLEYLTTACTAALSNQPAPRLIPASSQPTTTSV